MPREPENKLLINGRVFDDDNPDDNALLSVSCHMNNNLINDSLGIDSLTAVIRDTDTIPMLVMVDGLPAAVDGIQAGAVMSLTRIDHELEYGDVVQCFHGENMVGKFRKESIKRVGYAEYQLSCISDVGLLTTSYHYGGIYTGQSAGSIISDIIGGIIPYVLDSDLSSVPVYGLLSKNTRRDNLRDLLFAIGGQTGKTTDGVLTISKMVSKTPYDISGDHLYQSGSVTDNTPATEVRVTEHSYIALETDAEEVLYDGESPAESIVTPNGISVTGVLVEFSEPMHDLRAYNVAMLESGVNYAVLSGSPNAKLLGRKYSHTERILSRRNNDSRSSPKVVVSKACTLVNILNSENVANRMWSYYSSAQTVNGDMLLTNQKVGDCINFKNVFDEQTVGYISEMNITLSHNVKAKTTIISNYDPSGSGNFYSHVAVISSNGVWTVPSESKGRIRVVLIGGGQGGERGQNGEDGSDGSTTSSGNSGKGGTGGKPGMGGKIFTVTIDVTISQAFSVTIGKGGAGQTESAERTEGGATTFGSYSSNDGFSSDVGYQDLINGTIYGTYGNAGVNGGNGQESNNGDRPTVSYDGNTWIAGISGESTIEGSCYGYGGLGGGAAVGANGADGGGGSLIHNPDGSVLGEGGMGGNGADAIDPKTQTVPGAGGHGGHGGGGGGGAGGAKGDTAGEWTYDIGYGGKGSKGSDGADGIALIYY